MARIRITSVLALALLTISPALVTSRAFAVPQGQDGSGQNDSQIQADLTKSLNKSRFKNIQVAVQNGVVNLTGTVDTFADKEEADRKAHHTKRVTAVRNEIEVAGGGEVSDQQLQQKLAKALEYDRVGYGTTAFNAITLGVQNGVVTLGGHAYGPVDKASAVAAVSNTKGVKDVIDDIEVDPVSPMDDQIRVAVARAIYGYPSLNKYAIDPGKPIRISVQNGQVTLYGAVDTQADKDTANIRANGVPNVFKVTNNLQVANQGPERK